MSKKEAAKPHDEHHPIRTIEVIEVEATPEDANDDDVGVAPQRVARQPREPKFN
jgi:hypothetical protein